MTAAGQLNFTLIDQIDHTFGDDVETNLSIDVGALIEVVDEDGDALPAGAGNIVINVGDDIPVVQTKTDLIYANSSNPSPGGTGIFDYSIGADERSTFSSSNSDFSTITLGGSVGGLAITSPTVTWASETATEAVFNISFFYAPNPAVPGTTVQETGTLTFDKAAGTYTVSLDDPIESVTILNTATALGFTGYVQNLRYRRPKWSSRCVGCPTV